jgi:electron transport complex protein RnfC
MNIKTFSIGGIHPEENKLTHEAATQTAALPRQAVFPLSQHIGAPAVAVVQKGDKVKVGTKIADAGGFVSAPIFSSVSGTVAKIDTAIDATGYRKPCIIIDVEGDEWEPVIDRSDKLEKVKDHPELTPEEIVTRIKDAGVVGMGGACFPTFIKLTPPPKTKAECVIINAVECEPYITADYRLMMEHADEILVGLELLMKAAKVTRGYIGIETNKPKAIKLFEEKLALRPSSFTIEVVPLKQRYPQGGEKQLVDAVIGRQVPAPPAIPVNVGAIVQNVGTAFAVYHGDRQATGPARQLPRTHGNAYERPHRSLRRHARGREQAAGRRSDDGQGAHLSRSAHLQGHEQRHHPLGRRCPPQGASALHPLREVRRRLPHGPRTLSAGQALGLQELGEGRARGHRQLHRVRLVPVHLPRPPSAARQHPSRQNHRHGNHP